MLLRAEPIRISQRDSVFYPTGIAHAIMLNTSYRPHPLLRQRLPFPLKATIFGLSRSILARRIWAPSCMSDLQKHIRSTRVVLRTTSPPFRSRKVKNWRILRIEMINITSIIFRWPLEPKAFCNKRKTKNNNLITNDTIAETRKNEEIKTQKSNTSRNKIT